MPIEPEIAERIGALAREVGWFGLAELQFMRPADGTPRLIDFNSRLHGSLALSVAAGLNLPHTWAMLVTGRAIERHPAGRTGPRPARRRRGPSGYPTRPAAAGLGRDGSKLVLFEGSGAEVVELLSARDLAVPETQPAALLAGATALGVYESIRLPASHHTLLILTRCQRDRLGVSPGRDPGDPGRAQCSAERDGCSAGSLRGPRQ
ncbi:MAG: ATP-grasp domain-containing protein [Solirubrobacteraceae bacterium]